jgi:hypothetical protein
LKKPIIITIYNFQLWEHTVFDVVKDVNQAVVACRTPNWECLVVDLPSCNLLKSIKMEAISLDEECRQIRSLIQNLFLSVYLVGAATFV